MTQMELAPAGQPAKLPMPPNAHRTLVCKMLYQRLLDEHTEQFEGRREHLSKQLKREINAHLKERCPTAPERRSAQQSSEKFAADLWKLHEGDVAAAIRSIPRETSPQ